MPRISRKPLSKTILEKLHEHFAYLISSLSNRRHVLLFFQDFLTKEEQLMLVKRVMLYRLIDKGYKVSDIQSILSLSKETVRVHRRIWERGNESFREAVRKLEKIEDTELLWKAIENILKPLDLALRARNDRKARAKLASGAWFED